MAAKQQKVEEPLRQHAEELAELLAAHSSKFRITLPHNDHQISLKLNNRTPFTLDAVRSAFIAKYGQPTEKGIKGREEIVTPWGRIRMNPSVAAEHIPPDFRIQLNPGFTEHLKAAIKKRSGE